MRCARACLRGAGGTAAPAARGARHAGGSAARRSDRGIRRRRRRAVRGWAQRRQATHCGCARRPARLRRCAGKKSTRQQGNAAGEKAARAPLKAGRGRGKGQGYLVWRQRRGARPRHGAGVRVADCAVRGRSRRPAWRRVCLFGEGAERQPTRGAASAWRAAGGVTRTARHRNAGPAAAAAAADFDLLRA